MQVKSLQNVCRRNIRRLLGRNVMSKVNELSIGVHLKNFLTFGLNSASLDPLRICELYLAIEEGDKEKLHCA